AAVVQGRINRSAASATFVAINLDGLVSRHGPRFDAWSDLMAMERYRLGCPARVGGRYRQHLLRQGAEGGARLSLGSACPNDDGHRGNTQEDQRHPCPRGVEALAQQSKDDSHFGSLSFVFSLEGTDLLPDITEEVSKSCG